VLRSESFLSVERAENFRAANRREFQAAHRRNLRIALCDGASECAAPSINNTPA
jgi:hypothetical protein